MPIYQKLVNFNQMFSCLTETPIIINDLDNESDEDRKTIADMISTRFTTDMVNLVPSCDCGTLKGEFSRLEVCDNCNKTVGNSIEDDISPLLWFRKPDGIRKLISPIVLIMLRNRFKKSAFNMITWLTDTNYRVKCKNVDINKAMLAYTRPRGWNNFIDHFDEIMEFLFSLQPFRLRKIETDYLHMLVTGDKDLIFSDYLPLPNKALLIVEKKATGVYVDPLVIDAMDVIQNLLNIDNFYNNTIKSRENKTSNILFTLANYYESYFSDKLAPKNGQFRRHNYGTRVNNSFRCVITSHNEPHNYNELHVPWGVGLTALRPHLLNKLSKIGYSVNDSIGLLIGHIELYSELLDSLLSELVSDAGGGIPVLAGRNPSLLSGSLQLLSITKFKTDPKDKTVSLPLELTKAYNADFDGDEMHFSLALDRKLERLWYPLESRFNIFQLNNTNKTSNCISINKPVIASTSAWIEG